MGIGMPGEFPVAEKSMSARDERAQFFIDNSYEVGGGYVVTKYGLYIGLIDVTGVPIIAYQGDVQQVLLAEGARDLCIQHSIQSSTTPVSKGLLEIIEGERDRLNIFIARMRKEAR